MRSLILLAAAIFVFADPLPASAALVVENAGAYDPYLVAWADGDKLLVTKSRRGELRTWQASSGLMLQSLPLGEPMDSGLLIHSGGLVIGLIRNGDAVVIDRISGKKIWQSQGGGVNMIGQLASQTIVISNATGLHLMDYQKNLKLASWKPDGDTYCRSIQRLGNGRIAAIMADRSVSFLDEKTLAPLSAIQGDGKKQPFYYATAAQKGALLALATINGTLLADAEKPEDGLMPIASSPAVNGVSLSNDGQKIAIGNPGAIEIRGTRTGDIVLTVKFSASINRMAWSESDQKLAVTTSEHGIFVINTATGEIERNFGQAVNINPLASRPNCAVSDDSRKFALIDERNNLTRIDLADVSSSVTPFNSTSSPEMIDWDAENRLTIFTESSCRKVDASGKATKSIRPVENAFDAGPCGPKAVFFRNKDKVAIFNWKENEAIPAGGFPIGVGLRCGFSNDGKFAIVRENDEAGALSIRAAPTWDVVAQAPEIAADPLPGGVLAHPDGTSLTWIDAKSRLVSFDFVNKGFAVCRRLSKSGINCLSKSGQVFLIVKAA